MCSSYLFTGVSRGGKLIDPDDTDVMVFCTKPSLAQLRAAFASKGISWTDSYQVQGNELQFFIYDPLYMNEEDESRVINLAKEDGHGSE